MKVLSMNQGSITCRNGSPTRSSWLMIAAVVIGTIVAPARSQDGTEAPSRQTNPPPDKPRQQVPEKEPSEPPAEEAPPSLDDLLDIEVADPEVGGDSDAAIEESDRRALDAALAEQEPAKAFRSAIADMLVSSEMLEVQNTGMGTQRLQQRIVDRLQALIDSAARQQQQQQQQSSSPSQQQSQQDPGRRQDQDQQQQQNQQQRSNRQDQGPQDGSSTQPPPPDSADLEGALDGAGVEWGGLPPRMRELITQGMRDRVSEMYRSLTEAYYRRMAEEGGS